MRGDVERLLGAELLARRAVCNSAASTLKRCAVATEALHSAGVMEKEPVCAQRAIMVAEGVHHAKAVCTRCAKYAELPMRRSCW